MPLMSKGDSTYKLGRFTGVCAATDRTLQPGEECIACLCQPCSGFQCMHFLHVTPANYTLLSRTGAGEPLAEPI